jgi:hypothetical protein
MSVSGYLLSTYGHLICTVARPQQPAVPRAERCVGPRVQSSHPVLPVVCPGQHSSCVQPAGATFRQRPWTRVRAGRPPELASLRRKPSRRLFELEDNSLLAACVARRPPSGGRRFPSPRSAHDSDNPATNSKATAPGKPAAAALRFFSPPPRLYDSLQSHCPVNDYHSNYVLSHICHRILNLLS